MWLSEDAAVEGSLMIPDIADWKRCVSWMPVMLKDKVVSYNVNDSKEIWEGNENKKHRRTLNVINKSIKNILCKSTFLKTKIIE